MNHHQKQKKICLLRIGYVAQKIQLSIGCIVFFSLLGCQTSTINETEVEISPTSTVEIAATKEATVLPQSTAMPTATIAPTETAIVLLPTVTPSHTPTPEVQAFDWEDDILITYTHEDGIYRYNIDTEQSEQLVPIFNQGVARMSSAMPNYGGEEVVYWFVEGPWYVVKAVNTKTGRDRSLLSITDDEFTFARGGWLGQGRFFELAIWGEDENGVPLVKQRYLFDVWNDVIVASAIDRPGTRLCHSLSISPRSERIATWCSFESQFEEQKSFFVIETDGSFWSTEESENVVLITHGVEQQINSPAGNYIIVPNGSNATIVNVNGFQVYDLFEKDDLAIGVFGAQFSPDEKLLSYEYDVCELDNFCQRILDFEDGTILWDSSGLFDSDLTKFSTWSPDGLFFAVQVNNENDEYIIIERASFSIAKIVSNDVVTKANWVIWLDE